MIADADKIARSDGKFVWPNGARLAVTIACEFEPIYKPPVLPGGFPNRAHVAEQRYEATRGLNRILGIIQRHNVRCTFFVNGASAERHPEKVREIADRGCEVAAHSWDARDHYDMPRAEEDQLIGRVADTIARVTGGRPSGWLTPRLQMSENTIELIAKHGFSWHSDCLDDDLPYTIEVGGRTLVEVPRSRITDDYFVVGTMLASPSGAPRALLQVWRDEFDVLHRESRQKAALMSLACHVCLTGRPAVSLALDEFLAHVRRHPDVWVATGAEIAAFWRDRNIAPGTPG
jgi:peptidoglycan-N-acetylglucosamine deacetylase